MEHLSKRQFQVLEFIKKYFAQYGYAPALKEIATELGLKSTGTVHGHLDALEKKNYIQRSYGYSRGIHLIEENTKPLVVEAQRKYRLELLERFSKIIEKKKLPVPNPYGKWVKVPRYNEVMDEIISELRVLIEQEVV